MTEKTRKELKVAACIFAGSIVFTPLILWSAVVFALRRDFDFQTDYLEFYRAMFSLQDMVGAWFILLVPVALYEIVVTFIYYSRHPEHLRKVFVFPRRKR